LDERLRARFYPDAKQSHALNYAIIRDGKVKVATPIAMAREGEIGLIPGQGRFQVSEDEQLFVFYYLSGTDSDGNHVSQNRVVQVRDGRASGRHRVVPLEHPFTSFFTATTRAGSPASRVIDLLGQCYGVDGMRYARVRLY
jgi:hypothetical protein